MRNKLLIVLFVAFGFVLFSSHKVSAEADPHPPCDPGWNCVVPEYWVYPLTGAPLRDLCPQRKVLIPNAVKFYDSQGLITDNQTYDSSIYVEIWYSVYICNENGRQPPEDTSGISYNFWQNGTWVATGTHNNAHDGNVGGNGGAWTGVGFNVNLSMDWNLLQHRLAGGVSEPPGYFSDIGYDVYIRRDPVPQPQPAYLDGVKIDDSGVSSTGSSSPAWGGYCYADYAPANCGNGSLASYPFSDDRVCIDGGNCSTTNYFAFSNIAAGNHTVSITPSGAANTGWSLRGYTFCADGSTCTSQNLTRSYNINAASSFSFNFSPGGVYHLRWIYTYTAPVTFTCGTATTISPSTKQPISPSSGQPFEVRVSFNVAGGTFSDSSKDLQLGAFSDPFTGGAARTQDYTPASVSSGGVGYSDFYVSSAGPGTYSFSYSLNGTSLTGGGACPGSVSVANKPYLRVYGGDVLAGSGFGSGCTPSNASARILTNNQGASGYQGSATNMAVFALGTINGFASQQGSGGSAENLSFSNTSGDPNYGGNFGESYCSPDYAALVPASAPGSLNISATSVPDEANTVVYANGDVTISGNIVYSNSGSWISLAKIPSYTVIVKGGNIYISNNVSQIDGTFVAQPVDKNTDGDFDDAGEGGTIYTCTNGSTPYPGPTIPTAVSGGCGGKLTINGSFIANKVKFLRTSGNINSATATEGSASSNIAEVFVYGPEIWAR